MKRSRLKPVLIGLAALLLIAGLAALPVVRELRQERKDQGLIAAVKRDNAPAVVRLLNEGANANARDLPRDTRPFWRVCWDMLRGRHRQSETLARTALLIGVSAPDRSPPPEGVITRAGAISLIVTPESESKVRIMQALLEHGADPNIPASEGRSSLWYTLLFSHTRSALLLIQHGAQLFTTDDGKRYSLLPYAAGWHADPSILKAMLDRGANINAQLPADGKTALIDAVSSADASNVLLLLAYHANVAIKDNDGNTALHIASDYANHTDIDKATLSYYRQVIYLLRQAGAR